MSSALHRLKRIMFILKSPILLFLILAGLIATSVSAWSIFTVYQSKSWPYIEDGRILEADCRDSGDGDKTRYVKYQYTVATQHYVNDREFFGLYMAEKGCNAGYRAGQFILVFYNPANPSDSVLRSGDYQTAGYGILIGISLLISALLTYIFERKKQALATASTPTENSVVSSADDFLQDVTAVDEPAVENKILHQPPVLRSKNFICHRPAFPMKLITGFVCVMGLGILSTQISDWKDVLFLFLVYFLMPCVLLYPISKAMKPKIYFWADKRGLFFPRSDSVLNAEQQRKQNWLFVPWQNVSNLRNATIRHGRHGGALVDSIAFDIKISPQQGKEFFRKVYCPADREQSFSKGVLSLGYGFGVQPPIAVLFDLMEQTTANDDSSKTKVTEEAAVKNQIFQQMPVLEEEHLVYDFSVRQIFLVRLLFGSLGMGFILVLLYNEKAADMPLLMKGFVWFLSVMAVLVAVHPKTMSPYIYFLADQRGMFFPSRGERLQNIEEQKKHHWLFVPWQNILNLRTAEIEEHDGNVKAIAFDVRISLEEQAEFFEGINRPSDRKTSFAHNIFSAGYTSQPLPSIAILLKLKQQVDC